MLCSSGTLWATGPTWIVLAGTYWHVNTSRSRLEIAPQQVRMYSMVFQCPLAGAGAPLESPLFAHVMDTIGTGAPRLSSFDASSAPYIGPTGNKSLDSSDLIIHI